MTDRLPTGFDTAPLAPVIFIFDHKFNLKYRWEHPQFGENPVQDFNLTGWNISTGINATVGEARLLIEDHDDKLTDNTEKANSGIAAGDMLQIHLGKRIAEPYYFGICDEPKVNRPGYNQKTIEIKSVGYGTRFAEKHIAINHQQKLQPNGDLDDTDSTAKVSEIVKRILSDYSVILQPPPDLNLTIDVDDIDLKVAKYSKAVNTTQATAIGELANLASAIYGVDPNLRFFFHPENISSGFVITNDLQLNVDVDQLMIIRNEPYGYENSTVRGAYTNLIGTDVTQSTEAYPDNKGTTQATLHSYERVGFRIPWTGAIDNLQISFTRLGNVTSVLDWWLVYKTASQDVFRYNDVDMAAASGTVSTVTLNDLPLNIAKFLSFEINQAALNTTDSRYFVVSTVSPNIKINMKNTGFGYYPVFDSNGQSFGEGGTIRSRIPIERHVLLKAQNMTLKHVKLEKENNQSFSNAPSSNTATQIFEGLMDTAGRVRRTYTGLTVSVPTTYPPLGKLYRIIDRFQGLDSYALLIGFDIGATKSTYLTATDMSLELEEWV